MSAGATSRSWGRGLGCLPSLCAGQPCDHRPPPGLGAEGSSAQRRPGHTSVHQARRLSSQDAGKPACPQGAGGGVPERPTNSLCRGKRAPQGAGPCPRYLHQCRAQPEDAHSQQVLLEPHLHRLVTRLEGEQPSEGSASTTGQEVARHPQAPGRNQQAGRAHRLPPGAGGVQPAAVAELQAAGVGHASGVVDLEPVRVVGDAAAAELREARARTLLRAHTTPPAPQAPPPAQAPPLTSVWMMLQALVRPTFPGVPYRCSPFFRSSCACLSICGGGGVSGAALAS